MTGIRYFTCWRCHRDFNIEPDWTADDMRQELVRNFGTDALAEPLDVLCDDCYRDFMAWRKRP